MQLILSMALLLSAVVAWSPSMLLRDRESVPLLRLLRWLMAAVSAWCATSALHAIVPTLAAKLLLAKLQYVAICSVAPLWLMLAAEYAGVQWFAAPSRPAFIWRLVMLWAIPVSGVAVAASNEWHHWLWTQVSLDGGRAVYAHGWYFDVLVAFNYAAMSVSTILLARTLRRSPLPFRRQIVALLAAALVPWLGNALYVAGVLPPAVDPTPVAFTASGLLFAWAICRSHLFDLLPIARDLVIDGLSDAVIVIDRGRRIVDDNAAAEALIADCAGDAAAPRSSAGQPLDVALPFLQNVAADEAAGDSKLVTISGPHDTWHEVRVMPLRTRSGRWVGSVIVLRDVTAERAAAAEREALHERMDEQHRRESLSILAGGLAHDFNNILAGVVGHADLLAMQLSPTSDMGASVGAILLGAQRAADLVAKMLAYAGQRHGSMESIDLDALIRDLLRLLRASAARHCAIHHKGQPATVVGDPTQIRQVAMNLIINAAEAVQEGTGEIHITTGVQRLTDDQLEEIDFGGKAEPGRYAFLDVRDNGCGMDADTLRRIFDPFFTTKHAGHGLGLPAVQGIVRGHRGAMRVESDPSWGARFRVWFPMTADDPALRDAEQAAAMV